MFVSAGLMVVATLLGMVSTGPVTPEGDTEDHNPGAPGFGRFLNGVFLLGVLLFAAILVLAVLSWFGVFEDTAIDPPV